MDAAALRTLEYPKIVERLTEAASTSLGKELAADLLPADEPDEARRRVAETAEGAAVLDAVGMPPLGGARDIRALVEKAEKGAVLETHELLAVGSSVYAARNVKRFFKELAIEAASLSEAASLLEICGKLEKDVETAVDEHGALRDDASGELVRIRREIRSSQSRVKERLDAILRAAEYQKYFQDALVTMRGDRYVLPVKQEYRQFFPGIVHDQSASGATLFIEPMEIVQLNNDVKQLYLAEQQEIERILRALTAAVAAQAAPLRENCRLLAQIDFVFAKARLAAQMRASEPLFSETGEIALRAARHPLIDAAQVVPVDILLGGAYKTLLITGPNTGGKTVSMKTLGLLALMAQAGLFIPAASESRLPVLANVFADIGDEQSIEQSLSTFSAHMTHIVAILRQAGPRDLLLLDELGAGTDPEEGAALAMSILEHLMRVGALVVATTHYSQLKTFAYTRAGIENASVEFDVETLRPTYRLLTGVPGASNAFAISRRLGLGAALIERAKELIDADHAQFENVLNQLETEKTRYEHKNAEIAERERQLAALERKAEALRADVLGRKDKILSRAQEESANLVREARREAERVIRELKAQFSDQGLQKRQAAIDGARRTLSERLQGIHALQKKSDAPDRPVDPAAVRPGDAVYVATLGQKGTVLSVQGKDLFVQLGLMKTTVSAANCRAVDGQSGLSRRALQPKSRPKDMNFAKAQNVSRQIDIRGMLVDEAEGVVAKFLDDALLAGLSQVLVIHGKGTGALRKGIRAYLKGHRSVQDISVGELNEGGDGATVVQLR